MAIPTGFPQCNKVLVAPQSAPEVMNLPIYDNGVSSTSVWELSPEELAEVARTGKVKLTVWFGGTQPPVSVSSYNGTL